MVHIKASISYLTWFKDSSDAVLHMFLKKKTVKIKNNPIGIMWYIREEILSKTRNSVSTGDKSKISAGYFISKVVIDALIYQFMSLFSVKLL